MRVAGFEFRERPFGLVKRGFEEGVAVAGEHYVVAEGDHDGEHGGGWPEYGWRSAMWAPVC